MLSRYVALPPAAWRFVENDYGRPMIHPDHDVPLLRFNLSHSRGLVACAITLARDIGIDVECTHRREGISGIANRFFALQEVFELQARPETQRAACFFEYWTLKEAYIKARGMGLSLDLRNFAFLLLPEEAPIRVCFTGAIRDDPASWQFAAWSPTACYRAALAVRTGVGAPATTLRIHETMPFGDVVEVHPFVRRGTDR
jgi:4'-phosphopantetheinyl transferase